MKPIIEHPNLEPGKLGLALQSALELDVLTAGLRYVVDGSMTPDIRDVARTVLSYHVQLSRQIEGILRASATAEREITAMEFPIVKEPEVVVAEMAIDAVAENEPGTTQSKYLQDPLLHQIAGGMRVEYQAALAELPQQPPAPPEA